MYQIYEKIKTSEEFINIFILDLFQNTNLISTLFKLCFNIKNISLVFNNLK